MHKDLTISFIHCPEFFFFNFAQAQAQDIPSALETASRIKYDGDISEALSSIASAQAKNGLMKEAVSTFDLALKAASRITDEYYKSSALYTSKEENKIL
jgi:hypothetical protein